MDETALERAKHGSPRRRRDASRRRSSRRRSARSRRQIEALAEAAAELEATLPEQVGGAVHDGLRAEVLPVARHLAEMRGLLEPGDPAARAARGRPARRAARPRRRPRAARRPDRVGLARASTKASSASSAANAVGPRRARRRRVPSNSRCEAPDTEATASSGRTSRKRLPAPTFGLELDPAAERDRELPRDREPEPGALGVGRQEGPEDPLAFLGRDPRARCRRRRPRRRRSRASSASVDAAAVGRPAERVRQQVRDHLEHAVAVGDDHRRRLAPRSA